MRGGSSLDGWALEDCTLSAVEPGDGTDNPRPAESRGPDEVVPSAASSAAESTSGGRSDSSETVSGVGSAGAAGETDAGCEVTDEGCESTVPGCESSTPGGESAGAGWEATDSASGVSTVGAGDASWPENVRATTGTLSPVDADRSSAATARATVSSGVGKVPVAGGVAGVGAELAAIAGNPAVVAGAADRLPAAIDSGAFTAAAVGTAVSEGEFAGTAVADSAVDGPDPSMM